MRVFRVLWPLISLPMMLSFCYIYNATRSFGSTMWRSAAKCGATFVAVITAVLGIVLFNRSANAWLLALALLFCCIADFVIERDFRFGVISFGLAHLVLIGYIAQLGGFRWGTVVAALIIYGSLQYKYSFADSYITAVALNTDGTRAAVASAITHAGTLISRITVLDMSETEPIAEYESDGNLIFAVQWNRSGRVTAIGDTETLVSDTGYNFTPYAYDGRTVTAYTLIPSGAVVSVSNYAYGGDSTLLIFRDSAEPVESDLSGRAVWLSAAGNKVAALLSSSVVSTDLTTGRQEAACNVPADTKSIAMADESTVYLLGVREIRKENLKVIEADNTLSQTE